MLPQGEVASLVRSFHVSVTARTTVQAGTSLGHTGMLPGLCTNQSSSSSSEFICYISGVHHFG